MYAIVTACRSQIGAAGYDEDPDDIVKSVLAKWIGFEEYDPETGADKTDWNFNNYYKGRTLLSDLKAYFV